MREEEVLPVAVAAVARPAGRAAVQHADEVDDGVAAAHQAVEDARRIDVGLDHIDGGQQDQVLGALSPARGDQDVDAACSQQADDMAADETGAANDQDVLGFHAEIMAGLR